MKQIISLQGIYYTDNCDKGLVKMCLRFISKKKTKNHLLSKDSTSFVDILVDNVTFKAVSFLHPWSFWTLRSRKIEQRLQKQ